MAAEKYAAQPKEQGFTMAICWHWQRSTTRYFEVANIFGIFSGTRCVPSLM